MKERNNKGFSFIEVLVAVTIVAVISIPLYASFCTSAKLNHKAYNTQMLTTYAQQEIENIKTEGVDSYRQHVAYEKLYDGKMYEQSRIAKAEFMTSHADTEISEEKLEEMFQPFVCEKKDITIGGKQFTMKIFFEPAFYSQENAGSLETSSDVNISLLAKIDQADGTKYPIIAEEINQFEGRMTQGGITASTILFTMQNKLEEQGKNLPITQISQGIKKTVDVNLTVKEEQIQVDCEITYEYESAQFFAKVYRATYPLDDEDSQKVFILARPFQDTTGNPTEASHSNNIINIIRNDDSDKKVDVFLVRGYLEENFDRTIYNFDQINIAPVGNYFDTKMDGYVSLPAGGFYTNIKEKIWNVTTASQNIGRGEYKTPTYQVILQILDGDKVVTSVVSSI